MIDLRSDTVTRPTKAMLQAMSEAVVGDDVYGEDPTIAALEQEVARLLGHEDAVFTPSGTMANQIAIALHTRPGDSVLIEEGSHCMEFESGAAAALSGVQFNLIPRAANWSEAQVMLARRSSGLPFSTTSLLVVENTHNMGGGRVLTVSDVQAAIALGRNLGLALHCDGARLWNAAVALGVEESQLAAGFDTIAVCFSKGLGAPVGSALVGPKALMPRARKLRKMFGGGMRQAGYLAAAALYALKHHRGRLAEDHRRARALAEGLQAFAGAGEKLAVAFPSPGTNMVYFRFAKGEPDFYIAELQRAGIMTGGMGGGWLRAVFHLDVDDSAVEKAAEAILALAQRM